MNFGRRAGSCSFSRSRPICAITVLLLLSRYFSPQTASNSSSEDTTRPLFSHRYHKIENSIGVRLTGLPYSVHLWLSLLMISPRTSYSAAGPSGASPRL